MSYRNREIESKLSLPITPNRGLTEANLTVLRGFNSRIYRSSYATSTDLYWSIPEVCKGKANFLRLRDQDGDGTSFVMTVKGRDRNTTLDRLEIDLSITPADKSESFIQAIFGPPEGQITKTYHAHWIDSSKWDTICCYTVAGVLDKVFLEVESSSKKKMLEMEEELMLLFGGAPERESGSLYEMYISRKSI